MSHKEKPRFTIPAGADIPEARAIAIDTMATLGEVPACLRDRPMAALRQHLSPPSLSRHLCIGTVGDVLRYGAERLMDIPDTGPRTVVALCNAIASARDADPSTLMLHVEMPSHWRERIIQGMWNGMVLARRTVDEDRLWVDDPWILARPEIVGGKVVAVRQDEETQLYNDSQAPRHGYPEDVCDLEEFSRIVGMGELRWLSLEGIRLALKIYQRPTYLSGLLKRAPSNR